MTLLVFSGSWSTSLSLLYFVLVKSLMILCSGITFWKCHLTYRPIKRYYELKLWYSWGYIFICYCCISDIKSAVLYNNKFFCFQAFASEKVFVILSETLYNLLQLVSVPLNKKNKGFSSPVFYVVSVNCVFISPELSVRTGSRDRRRTTCW